MKAVAYPCRDCPYNRECRPGALGGSNPAAYIGQAHGPFALPCHKHCDFSDPGWRSKALDTPQCAGAAVFRTHIGAADHMPAAMPRMPANATVFASEAEFIAHHTGTPLGKVKVWLTPTVIQAMTLEQLARAAKKERP